MAKVAINELGAFTDVVSLDFNDLIAIGNGGTRVIAKIPAHGAVELAGVANTVDIAGSSSLVIDVGTTSADPDEFIDALDVDAMTVPVFNTGDQFTSGYTKAVKAVTSATEVYIKVTDAAIASLTAGKIVIGLRIIDLAKFA
jgi:hypothetical protein